MDASKLKKALQETDLLTPGVGNLNLEELLTQKAEIWRESRGISYEIAFHYLTHAGLTEDETKILIECNTNNPALTNLIKGLLAQKEDPNDLERPDIFSREYIKNLKETPTEETKELLLNLAECKKKLAEKYANEDNKPEAAKEYSYIAKCYAKTGRFEEAVEYVILSAEKCLKEGRLSEAAKRYSYAADYSHYAGNEAKVTEYWEKSVRYYLEDGKLSEAAKEYSFAAKYAHLAGDEAKAMEYKEICIRYYLEDGKLSEAAKQYSYATEYAQSAGDEAKVIEYWEKSIKYYLEDGNIADAAKEYSYLAKRYFKQGLFKKAFECLESSMGYYLEVGKTEEAAIESIRAGRSLNQTGRYLKALEYLKFPLNHFLETKDNDHIAMVYSNIGEYYYNAGMVKEAVENKKKSAEYYLENGDTLKAAKEYSFAGSYCYRAGLFRKAGEFAELSGKYYLEAGNIAEAAKGYSHAGSNYFKVDLFQKARECKEKSAGYYRDAGNPYEAATEYGYAGSYYNKAGMFEQAGGYKKVSAEYHLEAGNIAEAAKEYSYAGHYYQKAGLFREAAECKEKSAEYYEQAGNTAKAAMEYSFAASFYDKADLPQKAAECMKHVAGSYYNNAGLSASKEAAKPAASAEKKGYTVIESSKKGLTARKPRKGKSQEKTTEELRSERVVREVAMFLGRNGIRAESPGDIQTLADAIIESWGLSYKDHEPKKPRVALVGLQISDELKKELNKIPKIGLELGKLGYGGMLITGSHNPASALKDIISDVYGTGGERFTEWHKSMGLSQQIIWASALAKGSLEHDGETKLVLGLVHEEKEVLPEGDIYRFLADNAKRVELASKNEINWAKYKTQFTREGWDAVKSAAKTLDKTKLPEISALDPKDFARIVDENRWVIEGRYLELFRIGFRNCVERYVKEFDLTDDLVINQLRSIDFELALGNAHAAHYDPKNNKLVVYLSFDRYSPEERSRLRIEGLSDQEIENLELVYNDYKVFHEIIAGIHRAASNVHVKADQAPSQADTYTGDYTEGLCIYLSTKWRLESRPFSLTKEEKEDFWKMVFSQGRLYDPIGPEYLEQYLQVDEWLNMGNRERLMDKVDKAVYPIETRIGLLKELPRFPKYVQRMLKGRFHLSPDDLTPYTRIEDIEMAADNLQIIEKRMGFNPNLMTRIESYPEALVVKLVATIATARKDQPQNPVVKESLKLLMDIIQIFDQGEGEKLRSGMVYHTYTKVFPKVCEG